MAEVEKDDLLGEVAAAFDGLDKDTPAAEPAPVESPPAETAQQAADRARDEQGRFAKAEGEKVSRETLKLKPKAETPAGPTPGSEGDKPAQPSAAAPPSAEGAPAKPKVEGLEIPPVNWKGDAKVTWGKLPQPVRAAIVDEHNRVAEMEKAFEPVNAAIAPYRDEWVRVAGSEASAISQLGEFYKLYVEKPYDLVQHIVRTRGLDLGQLVGQPQASGQMQGQAPQAPDIDSLIEQRLQQKLAPIQQAFQRNETQQIEQTVAEFAADPRYPYFQDVKVQMGKLMEAGMAKTLPDAYDKAVRLNDAIWSTLQAQQAEEAKNSQAAEAERARKAAAASLRGSPLPNGHSGGGGPNASVHDDVRAAAAEVFGG